MKKLVLLLSLALISVSCGRDDDETTNPIDEIAILPTKISGDSELGVIRYDGNKILETKSNDGFKVVYEYSGNLITKMIGYNANGTKVTTTDFTYSNDKLTNVTFVEDDVLIKNSYSYPNATTVNSTEISTIVSQGTTTTYKDVTTFTLDKGNIVAEELAYYLNNTLRGNISVTYTYDDKNSVMKNITGWDKISVYMFEGGNFTTVNNNVLTKNHINNPVGSSQSKYRVVNDITYSANNYPTQIISKQYGNNNELNSTNTDFFEYNK